MATYEITVDGQRRTFVVNMPPDWATYPWGSLPLLIGLHGGPDTAEAFYDGAQIDRLMKGELTPDVGGNPVPQKLVAVFPQGLSMFESVAGEWNFGWSGGPIGTADVDDVKAIVECVERADFLLGLEYARLTGQPRPVTPFFADAGILIIGFSQGAAMAYRCSAELPGRPTKWGDGALMPTCIAVAEHSAGGVQFGDDELWPTFPASPSNLTGVIPVRLQPPPGGGCSLLHMQSSTDSNSDYLGGVSAGNMAAVDLNLGTAGDALFYRWDFRMGAIGPGAYDPSIAQEAIEPWVRALPGGPRSWSVNSITLDAGEIYERHVWDWVPALVAAPPFGGGTTHAVRFILWSSDPSVPDGHHWPKLNEDTGFLWSGTGEAWQFFLDHS